MASSKMRNYISYALTLFTEKEHSSVGAWRWRVAVWVVVAAVVLALGLGLGLGLVVAEG
jgi:hypothetical protein